MGLRAGALTVLALAALSFSRTEEWRTDLSLWSAAIAEGPQMPRSHLCLGLAHKDIAMAGNPGAWQDAAEAFNQCLVLASEQHDAAMGSRALNNLGSVAYELGELDLAEKHYQQAADLMPFYEDAEVNLASVMVARAQRTRDVGLLDSAILRYRAILVQTPGHAMALENLERATEIRRMVK